MSDLIVKAFISNYQDVSNPQVRSRYGILAGVLGIALNLCLFTAKLLAGILTGSIAITADAFNNLSDAGSSVLTLVGFKMAELPPDSEHPFGHGRLEYVSALAVSLIIFMLGVELAKSSLDKILHPQLVSLTLASGIILAVSVGVKLWMGLFNRRMGKRIDSTAMIATSRDSLTDAVATAAVMAGTLIGQLAGIALDGWIGMIVALFIIYTGIVTAKDSLSPLLGQRPSPQLVEQINETVMAHGEVTGIHDLMIHDYGPGRRIISLHAEVPCDADILVMHDAIDLIEIELREKYNCEATIHMDPVAVDDELTCQMKLRVAELVKQVDPSIGIHDFRMVQGVSHTNLIFDATVPPRFRLSDDETGRLIRQAVTDMDPHYCAVVRVEKSYV